MTAWLGAADFRKLSHDAIQRDIINVTNQDSPFDLLAPNFNLTTCHTDSKEVYDKLKSSVVRLASKTIHQTLFMVLVPGYSIEPRNVLDHIWQCYVDNEGKPVQLSAQVYYSTFLNAICSFYDLEEYPINLTGIFQIISTLPCPQLWPFLLEGCDHSAVDPCQHAERSHQGRERCHEYL